MVIRRFRHHVETHNWFAVAVDLLIVVVGVFLGAQATNWNDRRIEHQQGVSYRSRFVAELHFNARQFRQQISYYEQVRGHALATLADLQSTGPQPARDFLIHAYQSTQIDITPAKRFIYNEMLSSGLVDRLGDEKLQEEASDYSLSTQATEVTYNDIPAYRARMRTLIPQDIQSVIRGQCGDIRVVSNDRVIGSRLPNTCDAPVDDLEARKAVSRIRLDPDVQEELNRYLSWINEKIGSLEDELNLTSDLRQHVLDQS